MKNHLLNFVLLSFFFFGMVSCEETTSNGDVSSIEEPPSPTKQPKQQQIKPELNSEDAVALNDQVTEQILYIEDVMNQLQKLDNDDADSTLMYQKADSLVAYIKSFEIVGFDEKLPTLNSSTFMKSTFGFLEALHSKATMFKDYAGKNAIADDEWEEEWVNEIHQIIEPIYFNYMNARESFMKAQEEFITLHGASLSEV